MGCQLTISGKLTVGGPGCGCGPGGASPTKTVALSGACFETYQAIAGTDCPVLIQTIGIPGATWLDLPTLNGIKSLRLLYVSAKAPMLLRVGATVATLLGSGGTFPVTLAGGEVFAFTADGVAVSTTFASGAKTAAAIVTAINQAAVGAGLAFFPASVDSGGQVRLSGSKTGKDGTVVITTALAAIGFAAVASAVGGGADLSINGTQLLQFAADGAPTRVQVSGHGWIEVLAGGDPV
ncbi:hypothetical protein UFOVP650_45 [uncultured Caudovirales phage]|uniref:Uncharacterized protein n=1 Tax=uncultured Caudovirales phage TaxID=2100421 RepID=A0A6J5N7K8_9CAUD|nr:hypothetical protein UFOVP650_45 [uncultured Caudovirales phage]